MRPGIQLDDRQVEIQLERLRDAMQGRGSLAAMQAIGRYGKTSTQFRFRDQRGPDGARWLPSQAARERGGQTLRHTSRLFRSFTWQATPGEASWGTNVVYARVHQYGIAENVSVRAHSRMVRQQFGEGASSTRRAQVRAHQRPMLMHRRPFLGFSLADRSEIWEILRDHIEQAAWR
ncbi:MAG: phage virion morphogenesis protein [Xanthomonadaceae bacterium]|nr:phage virion morphogenesis protein [Xanthomonadaceae bacterium]